MARKNYSKIKTNGVEPKKLPRILWLFLIIAVLWFLYIDIPDSVLYAKSGWLRWLPFVLIFAVLPYLLFKFINNTWKFNSGWSVAIAIGSVLVVGPTFGIYSGIKQQIELKKNGIITKGVVTQKWYATGKGPDEWLLICKYTVDGRSYNTFSIPDKNNSFDLGDTLRIIYSPDNPNNSEILELTDLDLNK